MDYTHADHSFEQEPPQAPPSGGPAKKVIDVKAGPFAAFAEKRTASLMQKFIVPWNIAIHGLSYAKKITEKDIKAQLIAIIDSENLMPGYASCAVEASKYSVAFGDFAKRVKAAAGMYYVLICPVFIDSLRISNL